MFPRSWVQGVTADLKTDRQRVSKIQFALGLRLTIDDIENGGIADTIHSDGVCLQKGRQVLDLDVILTVFQFHHYLPLDLQIAKLEIKWMSPKANNDYLRSIGLENNH